MNSKKSLCLIEVSLIFSQVQSWRLRQETGWGKNVLRKRFKISKVLDYDQMIKDVVKQQAWLTRKQLLFPQKEINFLKWFLFQPSDSYLTFLSCIIIYHTENFIFKLPWVIVIICKHLSCNFENFIIVLHTKKYPNYIHK